MKGREIIRFREMRATRSELDAVFLKTSARGSGTCSNENQLDRINNCKFASRWFIGKYKVALELFAEGSS